MGTEAAGLRGRWRSWWIGVAVLVLYMAWMIGPYLRSIVVRDAAVTVWIHVATSPIHGNVDESLPLLGSRVGADGRILGVHNARADRTGLDAAMADVAEKEAVVAALTARIADLRRLQAEWQGLGAVYAATLSKSLDLEVDGARRELGYLTQRLTYVRALAARKEALARQGNAALAAADEANAELARLELERVAQENLIAQAELRRAAAAQGAYLLPDGSDPDWVFRTPGQLGLELARADGDLAAAQAGLAKARAVAAAEALRLRQTSQGAVTAPPGSVVWSMIVGAGAAVDAGTPVAQWLDCSRLMVDVPLSDVEVALLREGMTADVVLEGETRTRRGTVLLTRGAAATLGATDLAAVAKGRTPGVGQALLGLDDATEPGERCPVGLAAFVDFPELGLIDVLRARLRL